MDITTLRVATTVASLLAFIGVLIWAFAPRNARRFDEDAKLVFEPEQARIEERRS
ncbi:MAG: cbb3-type cytochrome c oxidase subunit 3 [Burkholderiaceae bacterium]